MPAPTYYQPIEKILNGKCEYEYYSHTTDKFDKTERTRICHVKLRETGGYNADVAMLIFTIRNQNGAWKIHSEGVRRTDPGSMVPLRNATIKLAKEKGWKFIAVAVAPEDTPATENVSQYVISIESYTYGDETVGVLTEALQHLKNLGNPDFYRMKTALGTHNYSLAFIKKEKFVDYLSYVDDRSFEGSREVENTVCDVNEEKVKGGYNKIYYGAPGCGKSFTVNETLDKAEVPEMNRIRVTFHPEYANCDFVGQILPTIEKNFDEDTGEEKEVVKYIFNPGPFTLALERARNTNDMVYLIIEEINRGNAAAIFGDLFQLLDRVKDYSKSNWGESEYPICNVNIQRYLGMSENTALVIPSNLTIFATMNTSDQNVFTLDTAFKRRWSFEQISNNIEKDTKHHYKSWYVPGTRVTLERFLTVINDEIIAHKITTEDKRMGKYFISKDCLTEHVCDIKDAQLEAEQFSYKVLEYIWNDVCKIGKDEWFDTSIIKTLEDLIDAFVNPKEGENPLSVFKSISF
jgi:hypothetical protein